MDGTGQIKVRCFTISPGRSYFWDIVNTLARQEGDWNITFLRKGREFSLEVQRNFRPVGFLFVALSLQLALSLLSSLSDVYVLLVRAL